MTLNDVKSTQDVLSNWLQIKLDELSFKMTMTLKDVISTLQKRSSLLQQIRQKASSKDA